ncbi:MAG: HDOD domain-containing protein [Desulfobacterales bacterium]|nr:HDOD domain-containing protein [Desulfobacterales bacterium]
MSSNRIDEIMASVATFPSMPGAAAQLLAMLDDPAISATEVEEALRFDPGLTANILRLSNSAYFGFAAQVGSVRQAVVLLGAKRLMQVVTATCVNAVMDRPVEGYGLSSGELWQHSIAVSVAAELLMGELGLPDDPEIFTAALLHDVGKLVLGQYIQDEASGIQLGTADGLSFQMVERRVLGTDHAEVGARILKDWAFPDRIVNAVRWHHDPSGSDPADAMVDLIHLANVLCLMIGIGVGNEGLQYQPEPEASDRLGLTTTYLERVASQTLQWVNEMSERLNPGTSRIES